MNFLEGRIHSLNAEVEALKIEVEAMNAANLERERQGKAPAYGEEAYQKKADEFRGVAFQIRELADRLG